MSENDVIGHYASHNSDMTGPVKFTREQFLEMGRAEMERIIKERDALQAKLEKAEKDLKYLKLMFRTLKESKSAHVNDYVYEFACEALAEIGEKE